MYRVTQYGAHVAYTEHGEFETMKIAVDYVRTSVYPGSALQESGAECRYINRRGTSDSCAITPVAR